MNWILFYDPPGVDEESNVVYVMGTADGPLERHLYALPLLASTPTPPVRLTAEQGMHTVKLDHQASRMCIFKAEEDSRWPRRGGDTESRGRGVAG